MKPQDPRLDRAGRVGGYQLPNLPAALPWAMSACRRVVHAGPTVKGR